MAKIKTPPVFEKINGVWEIVVSDCPICKDGYIVSLESEHLAVLGIKYAACDGCGIAIKWNAKDDKSGWRVLQ